MDSTAITFDLLAADDPPLHVFYGTVFLEILTMSQYKLQNLPLHVSYGTIYLEILNMS